MAELPLTDAETIRDEVNTGANTATRVGNLFVEIVDFINLMQIPDDIITPATLVADVDDYNPAGLATANIIRQDVTGATRNITGLTAPAAGINKVIYITNISTTGNRIQFMDNDPASVAANRFLLRDNNNRQLRPNETAAFWYDHTSARWRQITQIG